MKNHRSDIIFFFGVLLVLWTAYTVRDVLMLIYVSALFAVVISPAIGAVQRLKVGSWRPGRGFAIVFLFLMIILAASLFMGFAFPPIYRDAHQFAADWPKHLAALSEGIRNLPFGTKIDAAGLEKYATQIVGGAGGLFLNLAGGIFGVFTCILLTVYFILDGERVFRWMVSLFPLSEQPRLSATLLRSEHRMRNWLIGQALLMACLGFCSLGAYYFLHLRYFYVLAMFAGIANIIPIAGPVSAVIVSSTVAALDSPEKVLGVILFHAIYVQFESAILSPRVMSSTLQLSPLAVIIALSLGGSLAGVLGALVSVPTAALVAVFADEYLVKKKKSESALAASESS
jgi:predicted PurR-regulated permease PerM